MADKKRRGGLGDVLKTLADFVEDLGELSRKGGTLSKTGEVQGKQLKGVYGFTVKMGLGGDKPRIEPFGNVHRDEKSGKPVVEDVREPLVDVFEEKDHVLVVAEMPGIGAGDVRLDVVGKALTISAARGDKKYRKEVELPAAFAREKMTVTCNNGVLEIRCAK